MGLGNLVNEIHNGWKETAKRAAEAGPTTILQYDFNYNQESRVITLLDRRRGVQREYPVATLAEALAKRPLHRKPAPEDYWWTAALRAYLEEE